MDKVRRGGSDKQEASVLRPDEQELGCVEMECSESELVEERGSEQGGSQEGVGDKERSEGRGEGRGEMEQDLVDRSYTEGRSDSEIEIPDSEYDEGMSTLEELVEKDGSLTDDEEDVSLTDDEEDASLTDDEEDDSLTDDEEKKRISKVRRESRNKQWENAAKKEQIKEAIREEKLASKAGGAGDIKKPPSKGKVSSWKMELEGILPRCFEQQLIMLGMVSKHFPESSPIAIVNPGLIGREGKSEFYRKLQTVRKFLEPIPVKAELLLSWACDLALTDYEQFKAHGLSFSDERDIPVTVLIREKSENIKAEVWGNFRREDIRRLTLDHMI